MSRGRETAPATQSKRHPCTMAVLRADPCGHRRRRQRHPVVARKPGSPPRLPISPCGARSRRWALRANCLANATVSRGPRACNRRASHWLHSRKHEHARACEATATLLVQRVSGDAAMRQAPAVAKRLTMKGSVDGARGSFAQVVARWLAGVRSSGHPGPRVSVRAWVRRA